MVRNKLITGIILTVCLVGCKKEKNEIENLKELGFVLNLKNYKIIEKKVNDSVISIEAKNDIYKTSGNYNKNNKSRIGWWNFYKNNEKVIDIEFNYFDKKEHVNQMLVYNHQTLDSSESKMYTSNIIFDKKGVIRGQKFNFYTPIIETEKNKSVLNYVYLQNDKIIKEGTIENLNKNGSKYSFTVPLNLIEGKNIIFKGIFSEITIDKEITEVGLDEIYVEDTLVLERKNMMKNGK